MALKYEPKAPILGSDIYWRDMKCGGMAILYLP